MRLNKSIMGATLVPLLFVLLAMFSTSGQAQTNVISNCTFDASFAAHPPAWLVWNSGVAMAG
jgi:hypothetical protein